jgi:signal transduction histidine kinase
MSTVGPGAILGGRYRLGDLLKRGHGVEVYRGVDLVGGPVVVKLLEGTRRDPDAAERLRHEAELLRHASSAHLAPFLRLGHDIDGVYLVTGMVAGPTLRERLEQGPLGTLATLGLGESLLDALGELHDLGAVHRDLHPGNLIVDEKGQVTLLDLGLAASDGLEPALRELPVGTIAYLAPEQAGLIKQVPDERADLYAAGVVLFACLAGRPPFVAEEAGELLRQHLHAPVPELCLLGARAPSALEALIRKLLEKDPRDRYQTARAARHDLGVIAEATRRGAEASLVLGRTDRRRVLTPPSLVGRAAELALLEDLFRRGGLVLLAGESGIGKTRLLDALAGRFARGGTLVLRGQAPPREGERPFQVLEGVVRGLVAWGCGDPRQASSLRDRIGASGDTICRALPDATEVLEPAGLQPGLEEHGLERTVAALAGLLAALGTLDEPVLVLLDDCQWIDELTVRVLERFRRASANRVAVLACYRSEEVGDAHPLRALGPAITLAALSEEEIATLLQSMAGPLPDEAVQLVRGLAGGSPFLAEAALRGLEESGALTAGEGGWRLEPERVEEPQASRRAASILARRIDRLEPMLRRTLSVASVLGRSFELDDASELAGLPVAIVEAAAREARRLHLVWGGEGAFRFVHDRIRESFLEQLDGGARRVLHHRAAGRLLQRSPAPRFAIAYHLDQAGESVEALPHALEAATEARGRFALDLAERQFRIAERGMAGADRATRLRILEELADVLTLRDKDEEARALLDRALVLAEDPIERARVLGRLGRIQYRTGRIDELIGGARRALRALGHPPPRPMPLLLGQLARDVAIQTVRRMVPGLLSARPTPSEVDRLGAAHYYNLGRAYWFHQGTLPAIWSLVHRATVLERSAPSVELATAHTDYLPMLTALSLYGLAIAYGERALRHFESVRDPWGIGQSHHHLGLAHYIASRYEQAVLHLERARPLLARAGDTWEATSALAHAGYAYYRLGRLADAATAARAVHAIAIERGFGMAEGGSLDIWAKATGGELPAELIAAARRAAEGDTLRIGCVLQAQALRLLRDGEPERAAAVLEEARDRAARQGIRIEYLHAIHGWLATALRLAALRHPAGAPRDRLLARAWRAARTARLLGWRFQNHLPQALRETGLLHLVRGAPRRARRCLDASLAIAERLSARLERAETLLARGRAGRALGWPGAAQDEREATEELETMGAGLALGEPIARRPAPATTASLSLVDRFDGMLSYGRGIATSLAEPLVFESTRSAAIALLRGRECSLVRIDGDELARVAGELAPSRTLVERALASGRCELALDVAESESLLLASARSALAVPILPRGGPRYCLCLTHPFVGELFGDEERRIAEYLAALAAAALENVRSYAELKDALAALGSAHRELESAQEQLVQAGKLAALGQLGAGLAHELSQPLQAILGFALRLERDAGVPEVRRGELRIIIDAARRMGGLLDNVRLLARTGELELRPLDATAPLEDALLLVGEQLRNRGVSCRWSKRSVLPPVQGDRMRLQQVFLNLLLNARDALDGLPEDAERAIGLSATHDERWVRVRVEDSGPGVAPEDASRIFDPFFTRKQAGTGLGLSIAYGIAKSHGGALALLPGRGACFEVSLPVSNGRGGHPDG